MLDDRRHAPTEYYDGRTVAKTFDLAMEEATKLHPAAESLIVHAALLAAEPIPIFLFLEGRDKFGEPLASLLADEGLDEAVAALRAFALVERDTIIDERGSTESIDAIRLHRLVREVAAERPAGEALDQARDRLLQVLAGVYPRDVYHDPKTWARAKCLDASVLSLVTSDDPLPKGSGERVSELLDGIAAYREVALANYDQAKSLYERALAIREKVLGPEDAKTATSINNLGLLLKTMGDLAGARPLYERALAIRERVLGLAHPDTALSFNNLGGLLWAQRDFDAARPLAERALAIREKALGAEHPETAISVDNLASLLRAQGDIAGAKVLCERALAIFEKGLGAEHPYTAIALNHLANLLHDEGDLVQARSLLERALMIREKAFGPEHPETAFNLNDLGKLLAAQGCKIEARTCFERSLVVFEKKYGHEHRFTLTVRSNLDTLIKAIKN